MKRFGLILATILIAPLTVLASFQAYNGTTNLNIFDKIQCSTGLSCTRSSGRLVMSSSPTLVAALTLTGAEATDGILNIQADESDDDADDWAIKALASGNALDFQSNTSGSLVSKLAISTAGALTLADSEVIGNASDVVSITADDGAADLTLVGFEASAAQIVLQADQSDDNGDDWRVQNSTANALIFSNDTSGAHVAKMTISTAGAVTGPGTGALSGYLQAQVASTTAALTAAQCGSTIISNSADVQVLPEASTVLGCQYTLVCGTTDDYDINPDDADIIGPINMVAAGSAAAITPSAGDAIRCTDVGSSVVLEACATDRWCAIGVANGAWTDVN